MNHLAVLNVVTRIGLVGIGVGGGVLVEDKSEHYTWHFF